MPADLSESDRTALIAATWWLERGMERLDRADDGILRMRLGYETRERALQALALAMDRLDMCRKSLLTVSLVESRPD